MVNKINTMSRRAGIKYGAVVVSSIVGFSSHVSAKGNENNSEELESKLINAYGESEGRILYNIIDRDGVKRVGENAFEETMDEVMSHPDLGGVQEDIKTTEKQKPKWYRKSPKKETKHGHAYYEFNNSGKDEDGNEHPMKLLERFEEGSLASEATQIGIQSDSEIVLDDWASSYTDSEQTTLADADAKVESDWDSNTIADSGHSKVNVYAYGNGWGVASLEAGSVLDVSASNYEITAYYYRKGDAVTGDAEINLVVSYISDGSITTLTEELESPSGRNDGYTSQTESMYIPNSDSITASIEIYTEASTGGGGASVDYYSDDRKLDPTRIELNKLD